MCFNKCNYIKLFCEEMNVDIVKTSDQTTISENEIVAW